MTRKRLKKGDKVFVVTDEKIISGVVKREKDDLEGYAYLVETNSGVARYYSHASIYDELPRAVNRLLRDYDRMIDKQVRSIIHARVLSNSRLSERIDVLEEDVTRTGVLAYWLLAGVSSLLVFNIILLANAL